MRTKPMLVTTVAFVMTIGARPAVARTNGSCATGFVVVPSPSPGTNIQSLLTVTALSSTDAWAVGFAGYIDSHGMFAESPLIEHWDGSKWSISGGHMGQGVLAGVAAVGPNDVWAVGHRGLDPLEMRPLIVHWDGARWSIVPSPSVPEGTLGALAVVGPADIWAAGMELGTFRTVIEHWDGSSWTTVAHPSPRSSYVNFGALAAVSSDDVWLVGSHLNDQGSSRTLAEHWDGSSWTRVPTPNMGGKSTSFGGIVAVASDDVWASGSYAVSDARSTALLAHWDGEAWSLIPPNSGAYASSANGMAGRSNNDLWTVGNATDQPGEDARTLVLHSTGTAWSPVPSENVGDLENTLIGAAQSPDGDVWAVGFHQEPGVNKTLVEHFCP